MTEKKLEVGQRLTSKSYGDFEIYKYVDSKEVYIKFLNSGGISKAAAGNIRNGLVRDNLAKTVYGVGCIGEGPHKSRFPNNGPCTKEYSTWSGMMFRCYGDNRDEATLRNYRDCSVSQEWHNFQNFANWCQDQPEMNFPDSCLDKDILVKGNRVYSPSTCCFVPVCINTAITGAKHMNATGKAGVWKYKDSYTADVTMLSVHHHLGTFDNRQDAEYIYKRVKEAYISSLADIYKDRISAAAYTKLHTWRVNE